MVEQIWKKPCDIVLLGDSLTQRSWTDGGLAAFLADKYQRRASVLNWGFSGYNTAWAAALMQDILNDYDLSKTKLFTIWFGANDSVLPEVPQHVPLSEFKENIAAIVRLVQSVNPDTKILVLSCPPIDDKKRELDLSQRSPPRKLDRDPEITKQYAQAAIDVAKAENAAYVDIYGPIVDAAAQHGGFESLLFDGLHFSADGFAIVNDVVWKAISELFPQILPDQLPNFAPRYDTLGYNKKGVHDIHKWYQETQS